MPGSMTERMKGAAFLDVPTYEEVEHDETATGQAATVVAIVAVARAIGGIGHGGGAIVVGLVWAFVGWLLWSAVTYWIGTSLFKGEATLGELLRTIGFAQAPGLLALLGIIPFLGGLIALTVAIWTLVAGIVAIRQALDVTTGKAVLTAILGWLTLVIPIVLLRSLFH